MAVNYNFKKGIDAPIMQWLRQFPAGASNGGTDNCYDGNRYIYWVVQTGTTSTSASTTVLYRFCTWTLSWQYLASTTSGNRGLSLEFDPIRNVLYIVHGAAAATWQVFNLNTTSVTIGTTVCGAWALTTMAPTLPANADYGATILLPTDNDVPAIMDTGTIKSGSTTTSIIDSIVGKTEKTFGIGMVGCAVQFTSGALNGQSRIITAVPANDTITTVAFGSVPATGDTFIITLPNGTASSATANTLVLTGAGWTVNFYSNSDVMITSGTGSGQRRRIASNDATTLTLAAAVTGNANTGSWTITPDATSVFKIVPSKDFLYYIPGSTSNTMYRIDLAQTTGIAWSATLAAMPAAPAGGANIMHPGSYAPFQIFALRGNGTSNVYTYNMGLNTWATITTYWGSETINTGAGSCMLTGRRRIAIVKDGANRLYDFDINDNILEPLGTVPYAAAGSYDGHRIRYIKTSDGVEWIYVMRAGGQEFYRMPLEWF